MIYAKKGKDFFAKKLGIEQVPSKTTFGRVLSTVDGKEIGDAIVDLLRTRFGSAGKVVAVSSIALSRSLIPSILFTPLPLYHFFMKRACIIDMPEKSKNTFLHYL